MNKRNTRAVDARNTKKIKATKYEAALAAFLSELGIEDDTVFEVTVTGDRAVAKHVNYTRQDNGTNSGDFWTDVVERDEDNE